jgi:hypothetical protein
MCTVGTECEGGYCVASGGGGSMRCGECDSDMSCMSDGLGLNCVSVQEGMTRYRKCSTGELGERCEGDSGCKDNICQIVESQGGTRGTCGLCHDDAECQASGMGKTCTTKMTDGKTYPQCSAGALGETCEGDDSCESGICAEIAFGPSTRKVCSQCRGADTECTDAMLGKNCTVVRVDTMSYLGCGMGALGESCDSEAGCTDSHCADLVGSMVCSACADDTHCGAEQSCSLAKPEMGMARYERACVDIASVANDGYCLPGDDDEVCTGHCVKVDMREYGACGECRPDAMPSDCADGKTCTPPKSTMGTLKGSVCE